MDHNKRQRMAGQVRRFCGRFAQGASEALGRVVPRQELARWVEEETGVHRERIYGPLQTLTLFIEQVLSADASCQDAVARGMSQRVGLGQTRCSLNSGTLISVAAAAWARRITWWRGYVRRGRPGWMRPPTRPCRPV